MVSVFTVGGGGAEEGSSETSKLITGTPARKQEIPEAGATEEVERTPPVVSVCAGEGQNSVVWGQAFGNAAFCCGPNASKQLGLGKQTAPKWTQIPLQKPVLCVAAGSHHSLLCTTDGQVFSCGRGDGGQLGLGPKTKNIASFAPVPYIESICSVGVASSARRIENKSASYVLTDDGTMFAFGNNNFMKLGIGESPPTHAWNATRVEGGDVKFASFSAGKHHVLAIDRQGRVFAWGAGDMGRLGLADKKHRGIPTLVSYLHQDAPRGTVFDAVIARETFSLAFSSAGNCAYSWGFGTRGQLGRGNQGLRCEPAAPGKVVWCVDSHTVVKLIANDDAVIGIRKESSDHLCWGKLNLGNLAIGDLEPKLQLQLNPSSNVLAFDLCGTHAVIATENDIPETNHVPQTTLVPLATLGEPRQVLVTEPDPKKQRLDDVPALLVVPPPQDVVPPHDVTPPVV